MNADQISKLTGLAYQFGPFFFALLFTLGISRWAYTIYHKQQSADQEKSTYRLIFVGTTVFGMLMVVISVIWWWSSRPSVYVFRGEIRNLKSYERINTENFYLKPKWGLKLDNAPQIHDDEFVIIQDKPFTAKQQFDFRFSKEEGGGGEQVSFAIQYDEKDSFPRYEIYWDDSTNKNQIKRLPTLVASCLPGNSISLIGCAYAQESVISSNGIAAQRPKADVPNAYENIISVLQDERTDVGNKIASLNKLAGLEENPLQKILLARTDKESMLLTIADLTRHTDKELASKARQITQKVNVNKLWAQRLLSPKAAINKEARQDIWRLDKSQALSILQSIDENKNTEIQKIKSDILSGHDFFSLKPTGSSQGDRYYVRARWNGGDAGTVECLTKLFNTELFDRPSLEKETQFMKDRNERWIFWYSKEWALNIALEIRKCGAIATFESP